MSQILIFVKDIYIKCLGRNDYLMENDADK